MADRRPEDLSPPTVPFRPVPGQSSADRLHDGSPTQEHRELTERINAAYASSSPIVPDEGSGKRPSGAERFAAVLAATTSPGGATARPEAERAAAAAPTTPATAPSSAGRGSGTPRRVRKARLRLTHIDPWSVMKTAFLLAVALGIVLVVAVAVVWSVLGAAGVWTSINSTVGDVLGETSSSFRIEDYLGMTRVMGFTMVVAAVDVVLITVIATLGAFLYNLAATLLGGVEVILAEDDR